MNTKKYILFTCLFFVGWTANAQVFYNPNQLVSVQPGTQLFINGDLKADSTAQIQNNGTIAINGNWDDKSQFSGQGWVYFNSNSKVQRIWKSKSGFYNLRTNHFSLLLQNDIFVKNSIDLMGSFFLDNYDLTLDTNAQILTNNRAVLTNGTGELRQFVDSNQKIFPIAFSSGTSNFVPAYLKNDGTPDYYGVRTLADVYDNYNLSGNGIGSTIDSFSVAKTWVINEQNPGNYDLELTLEWNDAIENTAFNRSLAYQSQFNNNWDLIGVKAASGNNPYQISRRYNTRFENSPIAVFSTSTGFIPFNLILPNDLEKIELTGLPNQQVHFVWENSFSLQGNPLHYDLIWDSPNGNFQNPSLRIPAPNNGTDTILSFTHHELDSILNNQFAISIGDSLLIDWNIQVSDGSDSLLALKPFRLQFNRGLVSDTISNFNLISPTNNNTRTILGSGNFSLLMNWQDATTTAPDSLEYEVLFDWQGNNFITPLKTFQADDLGKQSLFSFKYIDIDTFLNDQGIAVNQTANLIWTVRAKAGALEKMANRAYNLNLKRGIVIGIDEKDFSKNIHFYPNPVDDNLSLEFDFQNPQSFQLEIFDSSGKLVLSKNYNEIQQQKSNLELAHLPAGNYNLYFTFQESKIVKSLIVR